MPARVSPSDLSAQWRWALFSWSRKGIILRAVLALLVLAVTGIPAVLCIPRLMATMHNAPGTWFEDDEVTWSKWRSFCARHQFDDVMMISWPGCELGSPVVDRVGERLDELTEPTSSRSAWLTSVTSGNDVFRQLTSAPLNLPDTVARKRIEGIFLSPGSSQQTCLVLTVSRAAEREKGAMLDEVRSRVATATKQPRASIAIVGPPVEGDAIDQASRRSMTRFSLPSTLLGAIVCWLSLRSLPMTLAVMAVAIWSQSISLAIIWWSGREMNAVFSILPVLCLVLAISSGIHLCNYFADSRRQFSHDRLAAIRHGIGHGLFPCGLAVATTCMGLLSLAWVQLWPVQWFGYIAALVLVCTLVLQLNLLPLAMLIDRSVPDQDPVVSSSLPSPSTTVGDRYLRWHGLAVLRWKYVIIATAILCMATSGWGIARLQASVKIDRMLSTDDPLCAEYVWFENNVGSLVTAEAEIIFPAGVVPDVYDRFMLVREAHIQLLKAAEIDGVLSLTTFLPNPPQAEGVSIDSQIRRTAIRSRLEAEAESFEKAGFVTHQGTDEYWRISVRYPHQIEGSYSDRLAEAEAAIEPILQQADPRIRLDLLGSIPIAEFAQDALLRGLTNSFLSAFLIIYTVMVLITRRLWASILLMLPNLFPTCVLFGILGWWEIPLDIGIVMTASVALGIAVDDTLHFLFAYRAGEELFPTRTAAILHALRICGRAMFQTTLICGLSMAVYLLSDFAPAQRFAVLMVLLLSVALMADLFILPAILGSRLNRI